MQHFSKLICPLQRLCLSEDCLGRCCTFTKSNKRVFYSPTQPSMPVRPSFKWFPECRIGLSRSPLVNPVLSKSWLFPQLPSLYCQKERLLRNSHEQSQVENKHEPTSTSRLSKPSMEEWVAVKKKSCLSVYYKKRTN